MAFSSRVLHQDDVARLEVASLTIAGLHRPRAGEQDVEESRSGAVHVSGKVGWVFEESDALSRLP
jgi:hypothetical protein